MIAPTIMPGYLWINLPKEISDRVRREYCCRGVDSAEYQEAVLAAKLAARMCYYCNIPVGENEKSVMAKSGNAIAHVTCWYDGGPFERVYMGRQG